MRCVLVGSLVVLVLWPGMGYPAASTPWYLVYRHGYILPSGAWKYPERVGPMNVGRHVTEAQCQNALAMMADKTVNTLSIGGRTSEGPNYRQWDVMHGNGTTTRSVLRCVYREDMP